MIVLRLLAAFPLLVLLVAVRAAEGLGTLVVMAAKAASDALSALLEGLGV